MKNRNQMVTWIETDRENPKPAEDRFYLISDGKNVSIGRYVEVIGCGWREALDHIHHYLGAQEEISDIKYWASLPLAPYEPHEEH